MPDFPPFSSKKFDFTPYQVQYINQSTLKCHDDSLYFTAPAWYAMREKLEERGHSPKGGEGGPSPYRRVDLHPRKIALSTERSGSLYDASEPFTARPVGCGSYIADCL